MCVGSMCTQPPFSDTNPPSVLFLYIFFDKSFPFSHIKPIPDAYLCDVTQTQAPPTTVDWH